MRTVTVSGLSDLIAVLPYQLGYHPRDSVVAVVLHGRRLGMVARVDIPDPAHVEDVVAVVAPPIRRERPDQVLLVGYEEEPGGSRDLLDALAASLSVARISIPEVAVVRDGRWYAASCTDPGCCPPEGRPVPEAARVPGVAAYVEAEVVPLADRSDLPRLVAEDPEASAGVEAAVAALHSRAVAGRPLRRPGRVWGRVLTTVDSARGVDALPVTDIAAAAYSLRDLGWRDGLIAWAAPGSLPLDALDGDIVRLLRRTVSTPGPEITAVTRVQARLLHLCRRLPDGCAAEAAEVCALTACVLWAHGDGALASEAVARALRLRPDHRLARLVEKMIGLGLRPSGLERDAAGARPRVAG